MQRYRLLVALWFLFAINIACSHSSALAATPGFTLSATNVTLSSSGSTGSGSSSITLTSVNGYTGTVQVVCDPPTPPAGVKIPYCNGPIADPVYTLAADATATGKMVFYNMAIPATRLTQPLQPSPRQVPALALAGVLLWGIAKRRRALRFLAVTIFAVGSLVCLTGITACGGSNNAVTPGTYVYQFTATDAHMTAVTASVSVTAP